MSSIARAGLLLFTFALLISPLHAQPSSQTAEAWHEEKASRSQTVLLGLNIAEYDYAEQLSAPLKSTEAGILPGIHFEYRLDPGPLPFYLRAVANYAGGSTTFDGSTQSGQPVLSPTSDALFNAEGDLAWPVAHFSRSARSMLLIYTGIGMHYWQRGNGATSSNGVVDYEEDYSWLYAPVGLRLQGDFSEHFSAAIDAQARFTFNNQITVHLTDIDPGYQNPSIALGSKIGYRIEAPLDYYFLAGFGVELTPWFQYSALGQSAAFPLVLNGTQIGTGQEPNSRTYEYGGTTSLAYRF